MMKLLYREVYVAQMEPETSLQVILTKWETDFEASGFVQIGSEADHYVLSSLVMVDGRAKHRGLQAIKIKTVANEDALCIRAAIKLYDELRPSVPAAKVQHG